MLYCRVVKHWIPNKRTPKCERQKNVTLNGSVPGRGLPVKLHQVCLSHACYFLRFEDSVVYTLDLVTRSHCKGLLCTIYPDNKCVPIQRPFVCSVDDCQSSYRRRDHLTRHMLQHQGKLFVCTIEGCKRKFSFQGNLTRHVKEFHDESASADIKHPLEHICSEHGCGKTFKYLSKLQKHENSHVKLDSVEAFCAEPDCMKCFSNEQCLKEHIRSYHQYIMCDQCGTKQLKKNIKRHMRMHEEGPSSERIRCSFKGCSLTFSTTSNLNQHIKAVHMELKPFVCGRPGCHERFSFKHVRNKHEISGCHIYTPGNFEESDLQFRSRPRGGRKRKYPVIETLMRKRIAPPSESELASNDDHDHSSWQVTSQISAC